MPSSMAFVVAEPDARLDCWIRLTQVASGAVAKKATGIAASDTQISSGATPL